KLGAKHSELVQKFVRRGRVGIFHNECTRSTPLDPKLMFWCVSYHLGAFGTVWLPYETRCKTGRTSAKLRATKSHRNLSQRTHPIHPIGPSTNVLLRFIPFGCIWDHYVALQNSGQNVLNKCKSSWHEDVSEFFATNAPDPPHWTLNSCFGEFRTIFVHLGPFGCLTNLGAKRTELVQNLCHEFALEFFATKAPDPPHWTLNSCFGAFRTILVHLEPLGCISNLGAKRAELVQVLVPRSRVRIISHRMHPINPIR